jgi:hypothetical protein
MTASIFRRAAGVCPDEASVLEAFIDLQNCFGFVFGGTPSGWDCITGGLALKGEDIVLGFFFGLYFDDLLLE